MRRVCLLWLLLIGVLSACTHAVVGRDVEMENANRLLAEKDYRAAIAAYDKIANASPESVRGATALFTAALARAAYDNPTKDYALALRTFEEFLRRYPSDERALDARNWRYHLKALLEMRKKNDRLATSLEQLREDNERLATSIQQLKQLDIRNEQRRK